MKKIGITLFALFGALFLFCCSIDSFASPVLKNNETITLSVPGMTCGSCPIIIKKALNKLNGVKHVAVNFRSQTAVVTYDKQKVSIKDLTKATKNVGYPSTVKRDTSHAKIGVK